jgi:hypothetical protein
MNTYSYYPETEYKEVELRDYQNECMNKALYILKNNITLCNHSERGFGKTPTSLWIAQKLGLSIAVVCSASVEQRWLDEAKEYGMNLEFVLSYRKLTGTSKGVTHDYLKRVKNEFHSTPELITLIKQGTLFIFDEYQNFKNDTFQSKAAHEIVSTIVNYDKNKTPTKSRIILASETPFDKMGHAASIIMLMGLSCNNKLINYNRSTKVFTLEGLSEIYEWCKKQNEKKTYEIKFKYNLTRKTLNMICFELLRDIVYPINSITGKLPRDIPEMNAANGYYNLDKEDISTYDKYINVLNTGVILDNDVATVKRGHLGNIRKALIQLEKIKVKILIRLASNILESSKNTKVILGLTLHETMSKAQQELEKYNPLMYNGRNRKTRNINLDKFQKSNAKHRLLIVQLHTACEGIELDDKDGNYPRIILCVPDYGFIKLHQFIGRIRRENTKSKTKVRVVYSKEFEKESKILQALISKSGVMRDITDMSHVMYPGEFRKCYEK